MVVGQPRDEAEERVRESASRACSRATASFTPPGVTAPIVGATKLGHLQDALAAEELDLSEDEMRRLEEPYIPHEVSGYRRGGSAG